MGLPLVGIFKAVTLGASLGMSGSKFILSAFNLYDAIDSKNTEVWEQGNEIISRLVEFTKYHHSALCSWSFDNYASEIFPAAMVTYRDAYNVLTKLHLYGYPGIPIGFIPSFFRDRVENANYYGLTKQEWSSARELVQPCSRWPTPPPEPPRPQSQIEQSAWTIGEQVVVGLALTVLTALITRKLGL